MAGEAGNSTHTHRMIPTMLFTGCLLKFCLNQTAHSVSVCQSHHPQVKPLGYCGIWHLTASQPLLSLSITLSHCVAPKTPHDQDEAEVLEWQYFKSKKQPPVFSPKSVRGRSVT